MLSQHEIGHKDIIAIRYFEKEIQEAISNLFITEYNDVTVLSIYSSLSKKLLALKVLNTSPLRSDQWLDLPFHKITRMDFNPRFSFIPKKFMDMAGANSIQEGESVYVDVQMGEGHEHFTRGILEFHSQQLVSGNTLYVSQVEGVYIMVLFKGRTCVFANSFTCVNEQEVLYFMLNALSVNELAQGDTVVKLDYSMITSQKFREFFAPYFRSVDFLRVEQHEIGNEIPYLQEMLFPNYLLSLCE